MVAQTRSAACLRSEEPPDDTSRSLSAPLALKTCCREKWTLPFVSHLEMPTLCLNKHHRLHIARSLEELNGVENYIPDFMRPVGCMQNRLRNGLLLRLCPFTLKQRGGMRSVGEAKLFPVSPVRSLLASDSVCFMRQGSFFRPSSTRVTDGVAGSEALGSCQARCARR